MKIVKIDTYAYGIIKRHIQRVCLPLQQENLFERYFSNVLKTKQNLIIVQPSEESDLR